MKKLHLLPFLMNPSHEFLGTLLSLPPSVQVKLFATETVSIVVRLKAKALRLNILLRWARFVVFAVAVVVQSYMLRGAAARKLRSRQVSGEVFDVGEDWPQMVIIIVVATFNSYYCVGEVREWRHSIGKSFGEYKRHWRAIAAALVAKADRSEGAASTVPHGRAGRGQLKVEQRLHARQHTTRQNPSQRGKRFSFYDYLNKGALASPRAAFAGKSGGVAGAFPSLANLTQNSNAGGRGNLTPANHARSTRGSNDNTPSNINRNGANGSSTRPLAHLESLPNLLGGGGGVNDLRVGTRQFLQSQPSQQNLHENDVIDDAVATLSPCSNIFLVILFVLLYPVFIIPRALYKHLLADMWNAIDIVYLFLVYASLFYHVRIVFLLNAETIERDDDDAVALNIAGLGIIFVMLRFLSFFRATKSLGPLIAMITGVIRDMAPFLVILLLFTLAGAMAMPLLMGIMDEPTMNDKHIQAGKGYADIQVIARIL